MKYGRAIDCSEKWLSATYRGGKHVLGSMINAWAEGLSWKAIVKGTKEKPAIYKGSLGEVRALEEKALAEGIKIDMNNGVDYYIYNAGEVIDATGGEEANYLRVEVTSDRSFHGHPMIKSEYNFY